MPDQASTARPLTVMRSRALRGRFRVAPEPTLFALAAMLAALARGDSVLFLDALELDAHLDAVRRLLTALGAPPAISDDRWEISGLGTLGLLAPVGPVDMRGSLRVAGLALGLLGPYGFAAQLDIDGRPLAPLLEALRGLGVDIREQRGDAAFVRLKGPQTNVPFVTRLPAGMPDAKAALLLSALAIPGVSTLLEAHATPDHAERLLRHFGAHLVETTAVDGGRSLDIAGLPTLGARTLTVAGDPDLAAFPIVAALVIPDSDVIVENVLLHPERGAVLSALEEMGGSIEFVDRRVAAGEEVADLRVRHSPLLGSTIAARGLSAVAIPPLAVAASFAAGETHFPTAGFTGEAVLHQSLAETLVANGATARVDRGGLTVARPAPGGRLGGGAVPAGGSPHFAAAFLAFGLAAAEPVTIDDDTALTTAFPDLIPGLESLGAEFYRRQAA